jgi:hypothetical protein
VDEPGAAGGVARGRDPGQEKEPAIRPREREQPPKLSRELASVRHRRRQPMSPGGTLRRPAARRQRGRRRGR